MYLFQFSTTIVYFVEITFFYFASNHFYEKKSPPHFRRWGSLSAHTRKKKDLNISGNWEILEKSQIWADT